MSESDPAVPGDRFRVFRQRLLILLSSFVATIGISMIVVGQYVTGNLHEALVGVGAALFATGPITVMVWWVTDEMYRGALRTALRDVVIPALDNSTTSVFAQINDSRSKLEHQLKESNSIARDCAELGITQVHLTRADALSRFSAHIQEEIRRAEHGQHAFLWFVCTNLRGFLDIETNRFNPKALLRAACAQPNLDLRILMADPEYSAARSETGTDSDDRRRRSYALIAQLQKDYGIKAASIRLYAFKPSVFAIASSRYMLLNPYPHQEEASRCMTLVVAKTSTNEDDERYGDIYHQYLRSHFIDTWTAATTRGIEDPPPLVSQVSLSADIAATNTLLIKEAAERPPRDADLIEFSGDSVRALLTELAAAGTRVRLLLKHPDSVGKAQRTKIVATYWYLKDYVFHGDQDAFQVRFYRVPATLRGRRLDTRLINIGWYTPDIATGGQISDWEIIGHLNPTITSDPQTSEGYSLNLMFSRTFDSLWGSSVTSAQVDHYLQRQPGDLLDHEQPTAEPAE